MPFYFINEMVISEVTSMEDKDDLVSQLIEEAIQSRGGDVENPTNEVPGR